MLLIAGDREAAAKAYEAAESKTAGVGPKMDLLFSQLRSDIALKFDVWRLFQQHLSLSL